MFRRAETVVPAHDLAEIYRAYIACLNARDLAGLDEFVHPEAVHNGMRLGLDGYRRMLAGDYDAIPDLRFVVELLVCQPPHVAARLAFDCRPKGEFLGLEVSGARLTFSENVFYRFERNKIIAVWSVIDKADIERQLARSRDHQPRDAPAGEH